MRAIAVEQASGPEGLALTERPTPEPGPGEVRVATAATGLNFIETYQRSGVYPVAYPFVPGGEAAGTVTALGAGVTGLRLGDRVTTAEARGTYAEEFLVAAEAAAVIPEGIGWETAAALPLQGLTAHYLANSSASPAAGEAVIVHAGAGGVGLLLTQLLAARGVRVFTTASTQEKRDLSHAAGAEAALPYAGFAEAVRARTDGEGARVVYDGVGRDTFDASLAALGVRGTLVLFGGASGQVPPFDLQRLNGGGSLSITRPSLGFFLRTPEERAWRYGELFDAVLAGQLDVRVGARFPLAEAGSAHAALEGRATTGKVLLVP